jgi:hypothetical protein
VYFALQKTMQTLMRRLGICLSVLYAGCLAAIAVTSCLPSRSQKQATESSQQVNVLTIFVTGSELGALKPCGCSGGQLGGFDRRAAVLNSVDREYRLIIDTGSFVESDNQQDLIKFGIIINAFRLLGYDLVNLTHEDIEIAQQLGLLNDLAVSFNAISSDSPTEMSLPVKFAAKFFLGNKPLNVTIVSFDIDTNSAENVSELFPASGDAQALNILILNRYDTAIIHSISQDEPTIDCIICPADSDDPRVISEQFTKPLVFSVGRFGRYVCKLQIQPQGENHLTSNMSAMQQSAVQNAPVIAMDKLDLHFSAIPVTEDLPLDSSLVELYKHYQRLVEESRLLETYLRLPLSDGLEYVGSKACQECHSYEYEMWSSKAHAGAFATLEEVGSQFDPECVICHVVGMDYESGFVWPGETDHLKNVGCENCHGPGSEHIKTSGEAWTIEPQSTCTDCHTPEQSTDYVGNEELYLEKIVHWMEPNALSTVEKVGDSEDL